MHGLLPLPSTMYSWLPRNQHVPPSAPPPRKHVPRLLRTATESNLSIGLCNLQREHRSKFRSRYACISVFPVRKDLLSSTSCLPRISGESRVTTTHIPSNILEGTIGHSSGCGNLIPHTASGFSSKYLLSLSKTVSNGWIFRDIKLL